MAAGTMERDEKPKKPAKPRVYERPRGGPAKPIADLMPQIGRAAFRRFGFVQSSVVTRWPEIVGERHAQVCMPEPCSRRIGSPAPRSRGSRADGSRTAPPSLKPIPMELGDSLRDIGDPELRTVLESLARSIGAKEGME